MRTVYMIRHKKLILVHNIRLYIYITFTYKISRVDIYRPFWSGCSGTESLVLVFPTLQLLPLRNVHRSFPLVFAFALLLAQLPHTCSEHARQYWRLAVGQVWPAATGPWTWLQPVNSAEKRGRKSHSWTAFWQQLPTSRPRQNSKWQWMQWIGSSIDDVWESARAKYVALSMRNRKGLPLRAI